MKETCTATTTGVGQQNSAHQEFNLFPCVGTNHPTLKGLRNVDSTQSKKTTLASSLTITL